MPQLTGGANRTSISPPDAPLSEPLWVSADVTMGVAAIVFTTPSGWHTTLVAFAFLAATWNLVWRHDDACVRRAGLAFGGLLIPGPIDARALFRNVCHALGWGIGMSAIVAVPFFVAWRLWWGSRLAFALNVRPGQALDESLGQLLMIALPEEVFYRGYLQSRLNEAWPPRWHVLGAVVGPGLLACATIFALGHIATVQLPARLAVFFPALLFGWLRARTGGVGASIVFHAFCNLYSQALGRGFGVY
jgi:CAAX protease family protein